MSVIKIGIIGCGKIFDRHAEAIKLLPSVKLQAASDIDSQKLQDMQKRYDIPAVYGNYLELVKDPQIDLVVICSPSGLHHLMATAALKQSKHVLCEKPLALSSLDGKRMVELAKQNNCWLFEVKQNRYTPAIQLLRKTLTEGKLGKPLLGNVTVRWCRPQSYYRQTDWYGSLSMDGGVILNQAIHHLDLLQWMLGQPISIMAKTAILNHDIEAPDTALAIIQFADNILGIVEATTCAAPKNIEGSITILGQKGTIKIGGPALDVLEIWEVEGVKKPELLKDNSSNHYRLYLDIIDFLVNQKPDSMVITGQEGLKSLLLAENIALSAQSKAEVVIDGTAI